MQMMKIQRAKGKKLMAAVLLAALLALVALPVSGSHTCVAGSDDYDQCVAQTAGDEPHDVGSEPSTPWYLSDCQSDDSCR